MEHPGTKTQGRRATQLGLYVAGAAVAAHLVVNFAHAAAHTALHVDPPPGSMLFILIVIFATPVLGFVILLRWSLAGAAVVAVSMLASLVFGVAYHFVIDSPDRCDHVGDGLWAATFRTTAVLLVITQLVAITAVATLCQRRLFQPDGRRT
jgi:hypothetical protein